MCGIYGEFFPNRKLSSKADFLKHNDFNLNRGPDMSGYWSDKKNIQLGFRRLSILDLSESGNQPMLSNNNRYAMVFNGEIYNFLKLKEELINKGYSFSSQGDSEVLVNYFECFGLQKTLDQIDGMFAIALYDIVNNDLTLIRDFAGIKPLHYSKTNENIVFGSRYDQIAKHNLSINSLIDKEVLKTYLRMHYVPAPYGILEGTFQLEPGQCITFKSDGTFSSKKYWQFPEIKEEQLITNKKEALNLLKVELEKAVKDQMISDVPLGAFLSGGIDSPLIVNAAKKNKKDVKAFSIGSDSKIHDESEDAKKYAKLIDVDLHLKKMKSFDAMHIIKDCMNNFQEPFADFSLIPTYQLTSNASKEFTVMLSGDGGDELFFGYERFNSVGKNLKYRWLPGFLRYPIYGIDKLLFKNKHINSCILNEELADSHKNLHSRVTNNELNLVFPNLKNEKEKTIDCYNYSENNSEFKFYNDMRNAEFYGMMQKTLTKVDRMSMANSLEVRVPFLQKSFINAAVKIHPKLSFANSGKKQILKDLLKKELPKSPIDNRKRGFTIPLRKWLREELKEEFEKEIFNTEFLQEFGINKKELEKVWHTHQAGEKDNKWFIFTIYSLQQWRKKQKE